MSTRLASFCGWVRSRDDNYQLARQWMNELATEPLATVTRRPPAGNVFIDVTIKGQRFQGMGIGDTMYISGLDGACALGIASINEAQKYDHTPAEWHICKYWHEATCALPLIRCGLRALAVTFGLPIVPQALSVTRVDRARLAS